MASTTDRGMTDASSTMSSEMQQLKDGFSQLRADVADLLSHAFGWSRSGAARARDSANDAMESLKSKFTDFKARGSDQLESFEQKIEENPLASALIAFGVGFLVAKMFGRRH